MFLTGMQLVGVIATQQPLSEIPRPVLPKNSTDRLAPFEKAVGLERKKGGDEKLNILRKRMVSWLWVCAWVAAFGLLV